MHVCVRVCVCVHVRQGYADEMDNPSMAHLIPVTLHNKKDILFGNMAEIYHFHNKWGFVFTSLCNVSIRP